RGQRPGRGPLHRRRLHRRRGGLGDAVPERQDRSQTGQRRHDRRDCRPGRSQGRRTGRRPRGRRVRPRLSRRRVSMKLYITTPSPFARKVRIVARERGLSERIEEIVVDPYGNAPELLATNPVVQVPTLVAEDGLPLSDSPVICEYLDALSEGARLLPVDGAERLRVRRLETLGNAALEMGVKLVLEKRRPEPERSPSWMERWTVNMGRALDALEAAAPDADRFDMGEIGRAHV